MTRMGFFNSLLNREVAAQIEISHCGCRERSFDSIVSTFTTKSRLNQNLDSRVKHIPGPSLSRGFKKRTGITAHKNVLFDGVTDRGKKE